MKSLDLWNVVYSIVYLKVESECSLVWQKRGRIVEGWFAVAKLKSVAYRQA